MSRAEAAGTEVGSGYTEDDDRLIEGEVCVSDPSELWFRQVGPNGVNENGEVVARGFRLTDADGRKLSGARGSKQTAEGAYSERRALRPEATIGTWALLIGELEPHDVWCIDDSGLEGVEPKGHAYADFRPFSEAEYRSIRDDLIDRLNDRGRLYP